MNVGPKRILLIDLDDTRRSLRVQILRNSGYEVNVSSNFVDAETTGDDTSYDLVILALHRDEQEATHYSDRLAVTYPKLPLLLLSDVGAFVPAGALNSSLESGNVAHLLQRVGQLLSGSTHIRQVQLSRRP